MYFIFLYFLLPYPYLGILSFAVPRSHFELSDAQQEHALAVESLVPRLADLRIELCPGYMSESSFWKIYFVLLHPRLEPQAAELLSTPEVISTGIIHSLAYNA
ncbi:putative BSD domain-containing protein [Helianthus annuus]|nr:putative BSD domain-containing protein [Helianthus annuus]